MKILIDEDMVWTLNFADHPDVSRSEYIEDLPALEENAKRFSLFGTYTVDETAARVCIRQQKITLDEQAMNTLFFQILNHFFEIYLEYAPLGDEGCDFAMRVAKWAPKC